MATFAPPHPLPVTNETVQEIYEWLFAPWVKEMGLRELHVAPGHASAVLPQSERLRFVSGAVCGQVIMSAVDSIASLAAMTTERLGKGTVYQHTHFLRPAATHDMRVEANVLRFGGSSAFVEARVTFINSKALVAHASLEFAFGRTVMPNLSSKHTAAGSCLTRTLGVAIRYHRPFTHHDSNTDRQMPLRHS